jgi:hypothetical protein
MNPKPPEYEAGIFIARQRRLVPLILMIRYFAHVYSYIRFNSLKHSGYYMYHIL